MGRYISKDELVVADCAEPRLIAELWDKGFNIIGCKKGKDSVRKGIANLQDKEIIIDPSSHNAKREANNYAWADKKSNTPIDAWNHIFDPLRYGHEELTDDNDFFVS